MDARGGDIMSTENKPQGKSNNKIILIVVAILIFACLCVLFLSLGGYFIFGDQIQDWLSGNKGAGVQM